MSQYPSLPLFTDAFLADTGHLSAQETGAYLLLMMMAWRSPDCRIPDDDLKLARWARLDRRTWLKVKATVLEFWALESGFWTQKRLSKEREIVSKRAEVARQNGVHGGRPKSLENDDPPNPTGSARDTQTKAPNPNPISKGSSLRSEPPLSSRATRLPTDWQPDEGDRTFCRNLGWTESQIDEAASEFRDYWAGVPGAKGCKLDWPATWRNRAREIGRRVAPRSTSPPTRPPPRLTRNDVLTAIAMGTDNDHADDRHQGRSTVVDLSPSRHDAAPSDERPRSRSELVPGQADSRLHRAYTG
jgi:uncharacterized protein YdaU (DUF1376 family)